VGETTPTPAAGADAFNEGSGKTPVRFPSGLQELDLKVGTGDVVQPGATTMVDYTGWLNNGTKFDSSRDRGQQLCVILAAGQQQGNCTSVIDGWNQGVPGMRVGGRRKLIIPPSLGYGPNATGPIPANSTLVFTIELASIVTNKPPPPSPSPT
jgi:peptidylprolyl isomerase